MTGAPVWKYWASVQGHDVLTAGTPVQVIDIQGDHRNLGVSFGQTGDRLVCEVRVCLDNTLAPPQVPTPHQCRTVPKCLRGFLTLGIVACPNSVQPITKSWDAAFYPDHRASEHHNVVSLQQCGGSAF